MNEKINEIQEFLHASLEELKERDEAERAERIKRAEAEQSQSDEMENAGGVDPYNPHDAAYSYTPENAHERKAPKLIDTTPREDEEVFKLPKAKVSEIEGNIEREDKERGVVLTRVFNKKTGSYFRRLYDVSGEKPVLLVSGDIFYKNGMFIVNYPNKQEVDNRGDYLKYMQSALYKLNKNNRPDFVAENVLSILDNGWFEQSSGVDYSVYLCKDADKGYKRIMRFSADMSGHREVSSDGRIIDELDRSDWYHKDVYQYDAESNTLRYVEGEGYVPDRDYEEEFYDTNYPENGPISPDVNIEILENSDSHTIYFYDSHDDKGHSLASLTVWNLYQADKKYWNVSEDGQVTISDYDKGVVRVIGPSRDEHGQLSVSERAMDINERKAGYDHNGWKYMELDCGTFLSHPSCRISQGGIFINKDGSENDIFEGAEGVEILENGLGSASQGDSGFVYDLKNSRRVDDYTRVKNLGGIFFAARKEGEDQFSIFEIADRDMKTPLVKVDACQVIHQTHKVGSEVTGIVFTAGDSQYRYEITPEKKLKPVAKKVGEKLFLSTGGQWVDVGLPEDANVDISSRFIRLERGVHRRFRKDSKGFFHAFETHYLSNDEAEALAHSLYKTAKKEKIQEVMHSYHNAKERLKERRANENPKAIPQRMPKGRDDR